MPQGIASVTTNPEALREAILVIGRLPVAVNVATLVFDGDTFTFCRDDTDEWYLSEVR